MVYLELILNGKLIAKRSQALHMIHSIVALNLLVAYPQTCLQVANNSIVDQALNFDKLAIMYLWEAFLAKLRTLHQIRHYHEVCLVIRYMLVSYLY